MASRRQYKSYFSVSTDTPKSIPRRTRYRQIAKRKLDLEDSGFQPAGANVHVTYPRDTLEMPVETPETEISQNDWMDHSDDDSTSCNSNESAEIPIPTQEKIFPGGRITTNESLLLIYGFLMRHKLSKSATSDLLILLNFHLPENYNVPSSVFLLDKALAPDYTLATKNFYCSNCERPVPLDTKVCENCSALLNEGNLMSKGNFFITFNLKASLEKLLCIRKLSAELQTRLETRETGSGAIVDIMDGVEYKSLGLEKSDITCSINTDGVNLFNSSQCSMWPILISINELTYTSRRKHTLLAALWFGPKKPNFETFLAPFVAQCNELSIQGIEWSCGSNQYSSKVYFPIVAADSVARCALQGIKQFNGEYGCPWCLSKGQSFQITERKSKWIYPPGVGMPRSKENFLNHLNILKSNIQTGTNQNCYGIKSASEFLFLKKFDIVKGFVFDYMHTCLLGIVRLFTSKWMESKYHEEEYYIGTKEHVVSERFKRCKVPVECNRTTRPLKDIAYWKASEWKTWMLLCIPVLEGILKPHFLKHFSKFIYAIVLLNSGEVSDTDLNVASRMLQDFCSNATNLYGEEICTFNMHILLHAPDCVRNWGPLWAYSLFQFEHVNGVLTSYFSGTNQICMQVIRKVMIRQQVCSLGQNMFVNNFAKCYFSSLTDVSKYSTKVFRCGNAIFLGPRRTYTFNDNDKRMLKKLDIDNVESAYSFKTCIVNRRKYSTSSSDSSRRVNCIVKINGGLYIIVGLIAITKTDGDIVPATIVKRITTLPHSMLTHIRKVTSVSTSTNIIEIKAFEGTKFLCGCDIVDKITYIAEMSNMSEFE